MKVGLRKYKFVRIGPTDTGWEMRSDLYAKCPKCKYLMSLDPTASDNCPCGNLHKDVDWGRVGARTGDHTIKVYRKVK